MTLIKKNSRMLLLRYSNYRKNDFIQEHISCINKDGHVWMLKTGKHLQLEKVRTVLGDDGFLILRAPKSAGGEYYFAHVIDIFNGEVKKEMIFPEYYKDLIMDDKFWMVDSLDGTWFKIDRIEKLPEEGVEKLRLISNGKTVEEVLNRTRSATLYIECIAEFTTKEL